MRKQPLLTTGLLVLGAAFVGLGILTGENTVIWRKAIYVCMECIGLG